MVKLVKTQLETLAQILKKPQLNIITESLGRDYSGWSLYSSLCFRKDIVYIHNYNYYNNYEGNQTQHCGSICLKADNLFFIRMVSNMFAGSPMPLCSVYELMETDKRSMDCANVLRKEQKIIDYEKMENLLEKIIIPSENKYNVKYRQSHRVDTPKSMLSVAYLLLEKNFSYFKKMKSKSKKVIAKWNDLAKT